MLLDLLIINYLYMMIKLYIKKYIFNLDVDYLDYVVSYTLSIIGQLIIYQ